MEKLEMTGIVLAGGRSSRMGENKALLDCLGEPLIERSLRVLQSVFSEVLISSNTPEIYAEYPIKVVPDLYQDKGPLGGLQASLEAARYECCFFVACDMPFLDPKVIRFLAEFTGDASIVVPELDGIHPLHAFYKKDCLPEIKKNLEKDILKIRKVFETCSVRFVEEKEISPRFPNIETVLSNINTPAEWQRAQRYLS